MNNELVQGNLHIPKITAKNHLIAWEIQETVQLSPVRGREVICDKQWEQTTSKYRAIKAKTHLFAMYTTVHPMGMYKV